MKALRANKKGLVDTAFGSSRSRHDFVALDSASSCVLFLEFVRCSYRGHLGIKQVALKEREINQRGFIARKEFAQFPGAFFCKTRKLNMKIKLFMIVEYDMMFILDKY